jgi:hypothetical protein
LRKGWRLVKRSFVILRESKATEESRRMAAFGVTYTRGEGFFAPLSMTTRFFNGVLAAPGNPIHARKEAGEPTLGSPASRSS